MDTWTPEKIAFSSFVGPKGRGKSLVEFLSHRFTYFSPQEWVEKIARHDVLLNGALTDPEALLSANDEVRYIAMTRPEPKVPFSISVLFEDEDLLIVNKPPHIPVHPGGRYLRNTLINLLKIQRKRDLLVLAHRLDRETSGVCVLTKTHLGKEKMYWQFFNNEVDKTYWALVWGRPESPSGVIDAPIGLAKAPGSTVSSRIRIKQAVGGGQAKSARTKYHTLNTKWIHAQDWEPPPWPGLSRTLESRHAHPGDWPISLVECKPVTGRTNQIRVHLAHLGVGVVGDKLYDPSEEIFLEVKSSAPTLEGERGPAFSSLSPKLKRRLVIDAHALHAKSLKFRHPRTGQAMCIEAPPPKSWHGLYEKA